MNAVVIFRNGARIIRKFKDNDQGIIVFEAAKANERFENDKIFLVPSTSIGPDGLVYPKGSPKDPLKIWCPYCRKYRTFLSDWYDGMFGELHALDARRCKVCGIREDNSAVRESNMRIRKGLGPKIRKEKKRKRTTEEKKLAKRMKKIEKGGVSYLELKRNNNS